MGCFKRHGELSVLLSPSYSTHNEMFVLCWLLLVHSTLTTIVNTVMCGRTYTRHRRARDVRRATERAARAGTARQWISRKSGLVALFVT
jgi:hypothetical protein